MKLSQLWFFIKVFTKTKLRAFKRMVLLSFINCSFIVPWFAKIFVNGIIKENNTLYNIIGATDNSGNDLTIPIQTYFQCTDIATTQSLSKLLTVYNSTQVILFGGFPTIGLFTIDLENRLHIEENRRLSGGLITFSYESDSDSEDMLAGLDSEETE